MKTKPINSHRSIEKHVKRWGSIDKQTASSLYKSFNLTAVLSNLKKEGWDFEPIKGTSPNTRWKVTKRPI